MVGKATQVQNVFSTGDGVTLAEEKGLRNIAFESDALEIVSAIRSTSMDRSLLGHVVEVGAYQWRWFYPHPSRCHNVLCSSYWDLTNLV